jgi:hypothetical protein
VGRLDYQAATAWLAIIHNLEHLELQPAAVVEHIPALLQPADQAAVEHHAMQAERVQDQQELVDKVRLAVLALLQADHNRQQQAAVAAELLPLAVMVQMELAEQAEQDHLHIHLGAQQRHQDKM